MSGVDLLRRLLHEVAEIKHRLANMIQVGPIADRDVGKGYRVVLGTDRNGSPILTPWLPHPDSGGESSTWEPLSKGQIVGVLAPSGDLEQAYMVRAGFGGGNAAPSTDLDEVVLLAHADVRISAKAGRLVFSVGSSSFELTPSAMLLKADVVKAEGSSLMHNDKSVGDSHTHTDVMPGGALSGPPN